jgi:HlyD family secretion protein
MAKLGGQRLTPGMPATVLIRGEARRVITYLTQPLSDQFALAFRE